MSSKKSGPHKLYAHEVRRTGRESLTPRPPMDHPREKVQDFSESSTKKWQIRDVSDPFLQALAGMLFNRGKATTDTSTQMVRGVDDETGRPYVEFVQTTKTKILFTILFMFAGYSVCYYNWPDMTLEYSAWAGEKASLVASATWSWTCETAPVVWNWIAEVTPQVWDSISRSLNF